MYAIVESGGKQYRVEKGQRLLVDRLPESEGEKVSLRPLLYAADGKDVVIDGADLEKVKVEAVVAGHVRGEKLRVFKYKAKKGYRRRAGHRSELTRLEIAEIKLMGRKPAQKKASSAPKKASAAPKKASGTARKKRAPAKTSASRTTRKKDS
jgi:large subunit ribosomal protein L21